MGARTEPRYEQGAYLHDLRLRWGPLYEQVLGLFGATTTIIPLGDPFYGDINSTTGCATVLGASGLATTFAYIAAPTAYTTPFGIPSGITGGAPEFEIVPGNSQYLRAVDAAYWTRALAPMSIVMWVKITNTAGIRALFSKAEDATAREFELYVDASDFLTFKTWDETANVSAKRVSDAAIPMGRWAQIVMTHSGVGAGANAAGNIALYVDGAAFASTATGDAAWVTMQDTTARVYVALSLSSGSADEYTGSIAGGPLGPTFVQAELSANQVLRHYRMTHPYIYSGI